MTILQPVAGLTADRSHIRRQRIVRTRRQYNQWVNNETLEDFALRFTAHKARRWSPFWVANAALGSIAFLASEAIGATVTINYGFPNTALAILVAGIILLLAGLPICYYGARYGVDMDLLTRGAGFGYLGSTITSAVYASFTFILFALEAVILSAALKLCFGIPLAIGHIFSALVVVPISAYGFRRISIVQNWTQPIWLVLQLAPILYVARKGPAALALWTGFSGTAHVGTGSVANSTLSLIPFGFALSVFLSLLPQIGEQVDFLRFLPERDQVGARRWWAALLTAGPGWIVLGAGKMLIGSCLAVLALSAGMSIEEASNPTMLYHHVFSGLLASPSAALVLTGVFVAICQVKINTTNAYAGSIASSNFFSRLTHRHPGRVVWLLFNIASALMLMEGGIQHTVERVLALYSNFAVAWFGAVTADLVINKPLGLSPPGIEFKRAHLYSFNPVGVGAMALSMLGSTLCFTGVFGEIPRVFSPVFGLLLSFVTAPLIAWATGGRYYLARVPAGLSADPSAPGDIACVVCENRFEPSDMAHCPVYAGSICSLCCTLEARCHDACKPDILLVDRAAQALRRIVPTRLADPVYARIIRFAVLYLVVAMILAAMLAMIQMQQAATAHTGAAVASTLLAVYACLLVLFAFIAWYFVLAHESRQAAEQETDRQTSMLIDEITAHTKTDEALQHARDVAESANLAKSRYIVGVSHEIRSPLNTISGYAQLLERDPERHAGDAARVIRRSANHLVDLVDGLVDISKIENGLLRIERAQVDLADLLDQIADMFRLQAAAKGLGVTYERAAKLPRTVFTDEKRLRQILINLVSNAIKYTDSGTASLKVRWRDPFAEFEIADSGMGIAPEDIERIFEPFERLHNDNGVPGVGLGLTITRLLVQIMGADLTVTSKKGEGSVFTVKMFLSEAPTDNIAAPVRGRIRGYTGTRRRILVTDNDLAHLDMVRDILEPLGFELDFATGGAACLAAFASRPADLIMLDVAMPEMDGWETARNLRQLHGEDPVILMVSANVHDFQRRRSEDDPHDDFLTKPYEIDEMLDRLQTLLGVTWLHQ